MTRCFVTRCFMTRCLTPRCRVSCLAALACALGVSLWSQRASAQILTLEDIEAKAQGDRAELALPRANISRAEAQLALVESKSGPTLGARAEGSLSPGGELIEFRTPGGDAYLVQGSRTLDDPAAFVPRARYGAVLAGKLTLLDFGRTKLGVDAARASIGAERASLISTQVELVELARSAYMTWVEAHQTLQLAERDAEVATARTVSVRDLISEGARPATDATLSAYDEQLARLRQNRAARAAQAALEALGAIVQSELPEHSVPDLEVLEPDPPPAFAAASATSGGGATGASGSSKTDSMLSALELSHDAALSAARAADRGVAPVLDAGLEVGVQGQNESVFPVYRAALTLTVPLWDGGAQSAQAAVHRAEAEGISAQRRVRQLTLERQTLAAERRWDAATSGLQLSLELLKVAEQLLTESEDHYRSGSDTLERVLSAQRSLVQARREVLSARLETARARLDLTPVKLK